MRLYERPPGEPRARPVAPFGTANCIAAALDGLLVIAAQVFLKGNVLQPCGALPKRVLLVCLPEEARVVEAGSQDTLVAMPDDAVWIAIGVQYSQKIGQ